MDQLKPLKYRRAKATDALNLWKLKNDEVVRANAINHEVVLWQDHCRWFSSALRNPHIKIWIIETQRGHFIGDVRIHDGEVSIRLTEQYRGKGIGGRAIARFAAAGQTAKILEHNAPSMKVFTENGFKVISQENGIFTLKNEH